MNHENLTGSQSLYDSLCTLFTPCQCAYKQLTKSKIMDQYLATWFYLCIGGLFMLVLLSGYRLVLNQLINHLPLQTYLNYDVFKLRYLVLVP